VPFLAVLLLGAAAISGCVTSQPRPPLPLEAAPAFSSLDGVPRSDRWWEDFDDPVLAATIERALADNFTLQAAYQRLREAWAIAGLQRAARSPTLDAVAAGAQSDGSDGDQGNEVRLGLEASYEVDLWGRIRSDVEAARLEATATAEDYQAAALSLSAQIALTLYQLAEASAQLSLLDSQLETNRDVLLVIENRFAIGQSGSVDVLRQRQLVEATTEQQVLARAAIELLEHQVLVLLGSPPQGRLELGRPRSFPEMTGLPEVGLPSALLQRRPDIRAAYQRLESADASVAAAVKDRYPSLRLGATISTAAENPSGLFSKWLGSLTEQLLAPLFDGGRRRRAVERAMAVRAQRLAEYGETVLTAFQDVEDALAQERYQVDRIDSLIRQLALAETTYTELRNQYLYGAADFIDVLVALRDQQELERSLLSARLGRIEQRIALHRAIAGGFVEAIHNPTARGTLRADEPNTEGKR
jgi:NodT family efflux transporter outer membrane factor (OMF) lipoprotein